MDIVGKNYKLKIGRLLPMSFIVDKLPVLGFALFYCMLFMAVFGVVALNAQEATDQTATATETENNGVASDANNAPSALKDILELEIFRPLTEEFELLDPEVDRLYFQQVKDAIEQVKKELRSTKSTLGEKKQRLDERTTMQGLDYFRIIKPKYVNYYRHVVPDVRNQFYLERAEVLLEQIGLAIEERATLFPLLVEEAELKKVIYEYRTLTGIVAMFRGSHGDFKKAVENFEYLLGKNQEEIEYISNDDERIETYTYLAGINDQLYQLTKDDGITAKNYLREKLFYLWNLVALKNSENEKLKDAKLQILFDRYASIIDTDGIAYQELYKPYRVDSVKRFKDVETGLQPADTQATQSDTEDASAAETPAAE